MTNMTISKKLLRAWKTQWWWQDYVDEDEYDEGGGENRDNNDSDADNDKEKHIAFEWKVTIATVLCLRGYTAQEKK